MFDWGGGGPQGLVGLSNTFIFFATKGGGDIPP